MVLATVAGGAAMMLVHTFVSKRCGDRAYAEFKALLSSFYVIAAVGGGLWMLFGQQTAAAVAVAVVVGGGCTCVIAISPLRRTEHVRIRFASHYLTN